MTSWCFGVWIDILFKLGENICSSPPNWFFKYEMYSWLILPRLLVGEIFTEKEAYQMWAKIKHIIKTLWNPNQPWLSPARTGEMPENWADCWDTRRSGCESLKWVTEKELKKKIKTLYFKNRSRNNKYNTHETSIYCSQICLKKKKSKMFMKMELRSILKKVKRKKLWWRSKFVYVWAI